MASPVLLRCQMNVIRELLNVCDKVLVTVTMDAGENPLQMGKPHQLFYMSRKMIHTLSGLTSNLDDPILLKDERKGRFGNSPPLTFWRSIFSATEDLSMRRNRKKSAYLQQNPL